MKTTIITTLILTGCSGCLQNENFPLKNTTFWMSEESMAYANPDELAEAALKAERSLDPVWGEQRVNDALKNTVIVVRPTETWKHGNVTVAGESASDLRRIYIGPSFLALAHEFAHTAEFWLDNYKAYDHETWDEKGIYEAVAPYEAEHRAKYDEAKKAP